MDKLKLWFYKIKLTSQAKALLWRSKFTLFFKKLGRQNIIIIRRPIVRSDPHLGILSR